MGYETGLLSGFLGRKREIEAERLDEAHRAADRESRVYESLLGSPDPEIQALAATGLLESARPRRRKGGISGWLGELEGSETYGSLQRLINSPVAVTEKVQTAPGAPGLPSKQITPAASTMQTSPSLTEAPMGTPSQSMTEPGAPPAKPLEYVQAQGPAIGRPPEFTTRTTMQRRKVFASPEDIAVAQARGKAFGDIEGKVQGLVISGVPEEEAREIVKQMMLRTARGTAGATYAEGNITPDPESPTGWSQMLYLRADPSKIQKIPAAAPGTLRQSPPNQQEMVAFEMYGKPGDDPRTLMSRLQPEQMANVLKRMQSRISEKPMTTGERFNAVTKLQDDWRQFSVKHVESERQVKIMKTAYNRAQQDPKSIPAASEAIIVSFERMLDPDSVVREAEARRPGSMQALQGRIRGAIDALRIGGPGITLEQLRPYVDLSDEILREASRVMAIERDRIEATGRNYDLGDLNLYGGVGPPTPTSLGPPPGSTAPPAAGVTAPTGAPTYVKRGNEWVISVP